MKKKRKGNKRKCEKNRSDTVFFLIFKPSYISLEIKCAIQITKVAYPSPLYDINVLLAEAYGFGL